MKTTERRLFWRDGECFIGDTDGTMSTATNLKILRFSNEGDVMAVDAGMGVIGRDAVWDLKTMSVAVRDEVCVTKDEIVKKTPMVLQFPTGAVAVRQ